jgi:hypothetical protein
LREREREKKERDHRCLREKREIDQDIDQQMALKLDQDTDLEIA